MASRVVGSRAAHVIEQHDANRLIRPNHIYTGPEHRPFVRARRAGLTSAAQHASNQGRTSHQQPRPTSEQETLHCIALISRVRSPIRPLQEDLGMPCGLGPDSLIEQGHLGVEHLTTPSIGQMWAMYRFAVLTYRKKRIHTLLSAELLFSRGQRTKLSFFSIDSSSFARVDPKQLARRHSPIGSRLTHASRCASSRERPSKRLLYSAGHPTAGDLREYAQQNRSANKAIQDLFAALDGYRQWHLGGVNPLGKSTYELFAQPRAVPFPLRSTR